MRHKLRAEENISERIGDRVLKAAKGEVVEFSARGAEVAMTTGKFEHVGEVPETEVEKIRAREMKKVEKLAAKPKPALVKQAARIGIANAAKIKKPELAEKIVEAESAAAVGTLAPGEGKGE